MSLALGNSTFSALLIIRLPQQLSAVGNLADFFQEGPKVTIMSRKWVTFGSVRSLVRIFDSTDTWSNQPWGRVKVRTNFDMTVQATVTSITPAKVTGFWFCNLAGTGWSTMSSYDIIGADPMDITDMGLGVRIENANMAHTPFTGALEQVATVALTVIAK